ncbi:MAG: hypothetical protein ABR520_11335 [Mycobacteriales bacterium]|nr:hypothetical protein [Actinomycetota bacterium]
MRKRSGNDIEDAKNELEQAKHRYLRSHGWEHTSNTPGCLWMWLKRCEYRMKRTESTTEPCWIMVDTDTAISMQRHSCAIRGNAW